MKKTLQFPTHTVVIEQDDSNSDNPRSWDNLGTCIFFHKNYDLGDKNNIDSDDYNSFDEMKQDLIKNHDAVIVIPVYLYDHSGITIKTTPFGDRWDSGQLGFIIATRSKIKKEYNVNKRISAKLKLKVTDILISEIDTLNQYITGDVYGFTATNNVNQEIDSCWGFYGDKADNGIFDHLDIDNVSFDQYKEAFDLADWKF